MCRRACRCGEFGCPDTTERRSVRGSERCMQVSASVRRGQQPAKRCSIRLVLRHRPNLPPSVQVLFGKLLKFRLITIAVLAAISTTGIDLTRLAVFGGALGVGVGLGLQRFVANLFSGLILLVDKSIKSGDVVAVGVHYDSDVERGPWRSAWNARPGCRGYSSIPGRCASCAPSATVQWNSSCGSGLPTP